MKSKLKRLFSGVCAAAVCTFGFPFGGLVPVSAENAAPSSGLQPTPVSTVTASATNSLGEKLLAASEQTDTAAGACSISDVSVEDGIVIARYNCEIDAELLVGFYSDDGTQLLASCSTFVFGGGTEITLIVPEDCPENFFLKAVLLGENQIPLSKPFVTDLYTSDFAEVRNAMIWDYPEELAINLDENVDTNFLVLNESTLRIESDGVHNVLETAEGSVYTFTNADEVLMAVKSGDIVYYSDSQHEQMILKADSVQINGTAVTLTDAGAELEDAFALIKIEVEDTADADTSGELPEGVTYLGEAGTETPAKAHPVSPAMIRAGAGEEEPRELFKGERDDLKAEMFHLEGKLEAPGSDFVDASIEGSLDVGAAMPITWKIYYQDSKFYGRVDIDMVLFIEGNAKISAEATVPLCGFRKNFLDIAEVKADIGLRLEGEVEVDLDAKVTAPVSLFANETVVSYGSPNASGKIEVQGELFAGLVAEIGFSIGADEDDDIVQAGAGTSAEFKLGIQVEANGSYEYDVDVLDPAKPQDEAETVRHDCKLCIDGETKSVCTAEGKAWIRLGDLKKEFSKNATIAEAHLFYFYFSVDHDEWGKGECPYKQYRVRFHVTDQYGKPLQGATVNLSGGAGGEMIVTDAEGLADFWRIGDPEDILSYYVLYEDDGKTGAMTVSRDPVETFIVIEQDYPDPPTQPVPGNDDPNPWRQYFPSGEIWSKSLGNYVDMIKIENNSSYWFVEGGYGVLAVYGSSGKYSLSIPEQFHGKPVKYIYGPVPYDDYHRPGIAVCNLSIPVTTKELTWAARGLASLNIPPNTQLDDIEIEGHPWWGRNTIKELTIPGSPKSICLGLESLEKLTLTGDYSDSILQLSGTNIKEIVFTAPMKRLRVRFPSSVEKVTLPEGLERINDGMFSGCTSLTSFDIPDSVTMIGDDAFKGCTSLTSINIPDSVTMIGDSTFSRCTSLTSIDIPDGVTKIGGYAFEKCTSLTSVNIPGSVTMLNYHAFRECPSLKEVILPEGVDFLGMDCFYRSGIESLVLPSSLRTIGSECFEYKNLKSITLPKTRLPTIRRFSGCTNLTDVNYPGTMAEFEKTYKVTNEQLYNGGMNEYFGFNDYTLIHCTDGDLPHEPEQTTTTETTTTTTSTTTTTTTTSVTETTSETHSTAQGIGDETTTESTTTTTTTINENPDARFEYSVNNDKTLTITKYLDPDGAERLVIPNSIEGKYVTAIGEGAFRNCTALKGVDIPEGIVSVGEDAFSGCSNLVYIGLPNSLTSVTNAFENCAETMHIFTPRNATDHWKIDAWNGSFWDAVWHLQTPFRMPVSDGYDETSGLYYTVWDTDTIVITGADPGVNEVPATIDGYPVIAIGDSAFKDHTELLTFKIGENVENIDAYAFEGCTNLYEMELPRSLKSIRMNALSSCTELLKLYYPDDQEQAERDGSLNFDMRDGETFNIGWVEHSSCIQDPDPAEDEDFLEEITDTDTGLTYRTYADGTVVITKVSGTTVTIPQEIGGMQVRGIMSSAFTENQEVQSVVIEAPLTDLRNYTFRNCTELAHVVLPDTLTHIGRYAFHNCTALKRIIVPENVTVIDDCAFYKAGVEYAELPLGLKLIDTYAFEGTMMKTIYFQGENNIWGHGLYLEHHNDVIKSSKIVTKPVTVTVAAASLMKSHSSADPQTFAYIGTPGTEYLLLAVRDAQSSDLLDAANLLYFDQQTADENGSVTFTYVCPEDAEFIFVGDLGNDKICRKAGHLDLDNEVCTICEAEAQQKAEEREFYALMVELGDANVDESIDASDAAMILITAAEIGAGGSSDLDAVQAYAADVNDDGSINATDAAIVLIYAAAVGAGQADAKITDFVQ